MSLIVLLLSALTFLFSNMKNRIKTGLKEKRSLSEWLNLIIGSYLSITPAILLYL